MQQKSAIMQMFLGKRGHYEDVPLSDEYHRLLHIFLDNDEALCARLHDLPDALALYRKTKESMENMDNEATENHYLEGFKFGFLMGMEVAEPPEETA